MNIWEIKCKNLTPFSNVLQHSCSVHHKFIYNSCNHNNHHFKFKCNLPFIKHFHLLFKY